MTDGSSSNLSGCRGALRARGVAPRRSSCSCSSRRSDATIRVLRGYRATRRRDALAKSGAVCEWPWPLIRSAPIYAPLIPAKRVEGQDLGAAAQRRRAVGPVARRVHGPASSAPRRRVRLIGVSVRPAHRASATGLVDHRRIPRRDAADLVAQRESAGAAAVDQPRAAAGARSGRIVDGRGPRLHRRGAPRGREVERQARSVVRRAVALSA